MNRLKCFSWAVLLGVAMAGCGPVAIRALDPGADGGATSDVVSASDAQTPGRCNQNRDCATSEYCAGNGCGTAGTCAPKATACTLLYAPVCGCDGQSYPNACAASQSGARVAAEGPCASVDAGVDGGPSGCTSNEQCPAGRYCAGNGCGTAGTCEIRPEACTLEYAPVCGCDGRTHGNACAAAGSGTRVASRGECARVDGGVDGGPSACLRSTECPAGSYCAGEGCGTPGACVGRPTVCTREYAPVCGCDGQTYSNACAAGVAGVRVVRVGACAAADAGVDAGARTCASARDCGGDGRECVFPEGACGAVGTCELPTPCFRPETWCSCAGETYESCRPTRPTLRIGACAASDAGVTQCASARDCGGGRECVFPTDSCSARGVCDGPIACLRAETYCACTGETYLSCRPTQPTQHIGACRAGNDAGVSRCAAVLCGPGSTCCEATGACYDLRCMNCCPGVSDAGTPTPCTRTDQCAATSYCASGTCGGEGRCVSRPEVCPGIYAPVCGCDGRTYSNDCIAASQGVTVARNTACP